MQSLNCFHCNSATDKYCMTNLRYRQLQYENSYGRLYAKDSKLIDHGVNLVPMCNKCVRKYIKDKHLLHYLSSFIFYLISSLLLFSVVTGVRNIAGDIQYASFGFFKFLCVLSAGALIVDVFIRDSLWRELGKRKAKNFPSSGVATGTDAFMVGNLYGVMERKHLMELIILIGSLVSIPISIFMFKAAFLYYVYVLFGVVFLLFIYWMLGLLKNLLSLNSISEKTREKAIEFYFEMDKGIDLL